MRDRLPGPASTQLAIYCAWTLRGLPGAVVGGLGFIVPGLVLIILPAAAFLGSPPTWVRGVAAGGGAVVAAVAVQACLSLVPASWRRAEGGRRAAGSRTSWPGPSPPWPSGPGSCSCCSAAG